MADKIKTDEKIFDQNGKVVSLDEILVNRGIPVTPAPVKIDEQLGLHERMRRAK